MINDEKYFVVFKNEDGNFWGDHVYAYGHKSARLEAETNWPDHTILAVVNREKNYDLCMEFRHHEQGIRAHMWEQFVAIEKKERQETREEDEYGIFSLDTGGFYGTDRFWAYSREEAVAHFRQKENFQDGEVFALAVTYVSGERPAIWDRYCEGSQTKRAEIFDDIRKEKKGFECFRVTPYDNKALWDAVKIAGKGNPLS